MHLFILLCLTLAGSAASAAEADESSTQTSSGAHPQIFDLPQTDGEAVLIVLDERGRNLKLTLLDGQNRRLAEFDTPGMSLGRLVVLVEFAEYPAARAVAVGPVRESSSAGTFTLSFSSLPPGEVDPNKQSVGLAQRHAADAGVLMSNVR